MSGWQVLLLAPDPGRGAGVSVSTILVAAHGRDTAGGQCVCVCAAL